MALVAQDLEDFIPEIGGNVNGDGDAKRPIEKDLVGITPGTESPADKRVAKREAAKRFLENKKKKQEEARKAAETLEKELKDKGLYDKLSQASKDFISSIINPVSHTGFNGTSVFVTVFGANPKVGDKVTLQDIFKKTLKGKASFDAVVKRWAEKGIVIEYHEDKDILKSTYTIKELTKA